jgi:RNA polymerase sigma factor (sigma-70 family)
MRHEFSSGGLLTEPTKFESVNDLTMSGTPQREVDTLVMTHIPLLYSIAHAGPYAMDDDIIGEGVLKLYELANRYDPTEGAFTTYAYTPLKKELIKAASAQRVPLRIPANYQDNLRAFDAFIGKFQTEHGYFPTVDEIVKHFSIDGRHLREATARELLVHLSQQKMKVLSLDTGRDHDESPLYEYIADPYTVSVEDVVLTGLRTEQLTKIFEESGLSDLEKSILTHYLGLDDTEAISISELTTQMGLTEKQVRYRLQTGLKKLRATASRMGIESMEDI